MRKTSRVDLPQALQEKGKKGRDKLAKTQNEKQYIGDMQQHGNQIVNRPGHRNSHVWIIWTFPQLDTDKKKKK